MTQLLELLLHGFNEPGSILTFGAICTEFAVRILAHYFSRVRYLEANRKIYCTINNNTFWRTQSQKLSSFSNFLYFMKVIKKYNNMSYMDNCT